MSILKNTSMGTLTNNREQELRKSIIMEYSNVNVEYDEKGNVIAEGDDWLKGLDGRNKLNTAILFENQAKWFLNEATDSESSGAYQTVMFPMVRRTFAKLLTNEIASVQALTQPSSTLFFFYPNISERVEGTDDADRATFSHTSPHAKSLAECVGANCPDTTYSECVSLYDRFYDDDLFDHSRGKFTIITATGDLVTFGPNGCYVPTATAPMYSDGSIRYPKFAVVGFDGSNPGTRNNQRARLDGGKGLEIDTEEFLASFSVINVGTDILDPFGNIIYKTGDAVQMRLPAQAYGRSIVEYTDLCNADGQLVVELDLATPLSDCDTCPSDDGYIGAATGTTLDSTQFAFAWRRYEDLEYSTEMGEVTFEIRKIDVSVSPRKLRARWSPELAQDVAAYHDIDAEVELTALLSEQIAMEEDRQTLLDMKTGAAWRKRWNYLGWRNSGAQKYTQKEWNQTFITAVNQVSAQIHKSTLRAGASFIVVSSEISALMYDLEDFMVSQGSVEDDTYNLGMRKAGTLSGSITVYVDPYSRANQCLVGYKGSSLLDSGYIYAPYVIAQLTNTIVDPTNFTNVKGIMTRTARKMVNNRFYGLVFVDKIPTFDTRELR